MTQPCSLLNQSFHLTATRRKGFILQAELVEAAEEQIRKGVIVLLIESEVTSVLELTAGEKNGHVLIVVARGVSEV